MEGQARHSQLVSHSQRSRQDHGSPVETPSVADMIRQPETRPISLEQLVAEVKGIYAGLVMVEDKCIEYDSSQETKQLSKEQFGALIALHRSVLHEHHDFFLASQHPSASEAMMAFLYETVPAFEDAWLECLGDLSRYRIAIEDNDVHERETWTGVSRYWYSKASDKLPTIGCLYYHLAILARPNALKQLFFYAKSLCVPIPFPSARESIMTLFNPLLNGSPQHLSSADAAFVRVHGIFFSGKSKDRLESSMADFLNLLDGCIGTAYSNWLEAGYYVGISLGCLLLGFGDKSKVLMRGLMMQQDEEAKSESDSVDDNFEQAFSFAIQTYETVLRRWGDQNTLSCIQTTLVFMLRMSRLPAAMSHLEDRYPWKLTSVMLNYLLHMTKTEPRIDADEFPGPEKKGEGPVPLPEDYALRGLLFAEDFFPDDWFHNKKLDETDRYLETPSKTLARQERILWIGRRIADSSKWLTWNGESRQFGVACKYDIELELVPNHDNYDNGVAAAVPGPVGNEVDEVKG